MEKVNILYSIIIPHYNIPELLQRCLNSRFVFITIEQPKLIRNIRV